LSIVPSNRSALSVAITAPSILPYSVSGTLSLASVDEVLSSAVHVPESPAASALPWHFSSAPSKLPKSPV